MITKNLKNIPFNNSLVPIVVEKEAGGFERSYDIYSRLLKDNIVFVTGHIDMSVANTFIAQMLFLENQNPEKDISVYINSPGGEVYSGIAMYDTIKHIKNDVVTINVGLAASAASLLLASGTKGKRFVLPNTYTLIHQPLSSGGFDGQATDFEIYSKHMIQLKKQFASIIAECAGQKLDKVMTDMERDYWMTGDETIKYGIADKILSTKKK